MKNLIIFCFILVIYKNAAQVTSIVPFNQSPVVEPNGIYMKDLDNVYAPYIGTWQGTWLNKTFKIIVAKEIQALTTFENGDYYYEDKLFCKYIVTDNFSGIELANTTSITDYNFQKITSSGWPYNNRLNFYYLDPDYCDFSADLYLKTNPNNPNELRYVFIYHDYWFLSDCDYNVEYHQIPIPIPKVVMTLTRVN